MHAGGRPGFVKSGLQASKPDHEPACIEEGHLGLQIGLGLEKEVHAVAVGGGLHKTADLLVWDVSCRLHVSEVHGGV